MSDLEEYSKESKTHQVVDIPLSENGTSDLDTVIELDTQAYLKRMLSNRQISLMAIGGSIGTALFVSIGRTLHHSGPANLLMAFTIYSMVVGLLNNGLAEMTVFMPVNASFLRHSGKWVDDAWGFMVGWNYFFYQAISIPFEIVAVSLVLSFWRDDIPVGAVCAGCIVAYAAINILAVKYYGEAEFWLCGGKVVLIAIVFCFTFITMVGGNPQHDAYGFRYWKNPGPFQEYISTGNLGRFEGFLTAFWQAAFTISGPDYIAIVAGETKNPRQTLKKAFKSVYYRFGIFYIGSALCVGIVIAATDKTLVAVITGAASGAGTGAASPYIIAMNNMGIGGLPHLVNALLITSIFSAGNTYTFASMRSLHAMSCQGHAPKFLQKCTKSGVPIYCFAVTMIFPLLSLLQLGNSSEQVLTWLINLVTAGGLIDYIVISVNYIFFYRALKAQGIDRKSLPYRGWGQPYCAWISLIVFFTTVCTYGYTTFIPGEWSTADFFSCYTMQLVCPVLFIGWKIIKRTKIVSPREADLVWDRPLIDAYEASYIDEDIGFWREVLQMFGLKKKQQQFV